MRSHGDYPDHPTERCKYWDEEARPGVDGSPVRSNHIPTPPVLAHTSNAASVSEPPPTFTPHNLEFDPIIPPGPVCERWIYEHRWHLKWGNAFCEVVEGYSIGQWVEVLNKRYHISVDVCKEIKGCI